MAEPTDEITIDLNDDGTGTVVTATPAEVVVENPVVAAAVVTPPRAQTDDPSEGVDALKRQIEARDRDLREAQERANRAETGRAEADRRAAVADQEARRQAVVASDSQFDSIANALNASEREMDHLIQLKTAAMEEGRHSDAAKLDGQMTKVGSRITQFETAKHELEERRKLAPVVETPAIQPVVTAEQQRESFLATLPPKSAVWIRSQPRYFTDSEFARRVNSAAAYAENNKGLHHETDEYFRFIEQELGLSQAPAATQAPVSAAAAPVQDRQSQKVAPVAATPSRSVPDSNGQPKKASQVTLTAEERAMAPHLFPKRKPSDPDPEIAYARQKLSMIQDGYQFSGRRQ